MLSRFVDYFVVCGLDVNGGLEVLAHPHLDTEQGSNGESYSSSTSAPLQRSYKPKILANHPDSVPWNPFDQDAVRNLCLPDGLVFRTQKHDLSSSFHPFVITRENGSRCYGFSLLVYEQVTSSHIHQAILTLQAMHLTELSSAKHYHQRRAQQSRNIRNAQATLQQHRKKHKEWYSGGGGGGVEEGGEGGVMTEAELEGDSNTRSLPRHFKLAAHKGTSLQSFYDSTKDTLYASKAIALICPLPFVQAAHHFLQGLHTRSLSPSPDSLSIESFIYHLLYHVPLPPPSASIQLSYWGQPLTCVRPGTHQLPLLDYFFGDVFRILDLDSFLQLFTCVALENQVLLVSKNLYKLMLVAETITALLFPFNWQHVYVPILPSTLLHFLDAPVPFIMGLHVETGWDESRSGSGGVPVCEANLCLVDVDKNHVTVPEDLPPFPHRSDLIQELAQVLKQYGIPVGDISQSSLGINPVYSYHVPPSPYRMRRARPRKNSWSHNDSDSGMSSNEEVFASSHHSTSPSFLRRRRSEKKHNNNNDSSPWVGGIGEIGPQERLDDVYLRNLKLNNCVREIFANRFVHMFSSYHHFLSTENEEDGNRMFVHGFDKATFLSDQPDQDLPFLSRFIETQMFASFIDRKIASLGGEEMEGNLALFEHKIKLLRDKFGESLVRTPAYEPCGTNHKEAERALEQRFAIPDFVAPSVVEILAEEKASLAIASSRNGAFPPLDAKYLNCGPTDTRNLKLLRETSTVVDESIPKCNSGKAASSSLRSMGTTASPASIAQANWEFIKQLLQECKTKTKRMLVEKMGPEAAALGHGEVSIMGVEENTLVASLCDLLERIWAHGLHVKGKGRSPLWNYLINYQESEACKDDASKPVDPQFLTPDLSAMASELNLNSSSATNVTTLSSPATPSHTTPEHKSRRGRSGSRSGDSSAISPLPISITFDIRSVQSISEIKTEIGYARAWIRLSLEKKVLSKHLRALLADDELLRGFYKRTAFLRSEDEREQFLYHLLTLNAADYHCFTNTYINIVLPYRVLIFPSRRFGLSTTMTSATVWISVSGTLGETPAVSVPKNTLEFVFQHKNLGLLTNMHIGHDNSGPSPKWMVDYVVVRNEVTGRVVKFPCGRWLGKEVDDGSTERLLVGEPYRDLEDQDSTTITSSTSSSVRSSTPARTRSPSLPRYHHQDAVGPQEIQEQVGNAVNAIVKYFFKTDRERGSLTVLLCGEHGLVVALEQVFNYGFKSQRLFGRNIFLWDYFVQVGQVFAGRLKGMKSGGRRPVGGGGGSDDPDLLTAYCSLIYKINTRANTLGKNGKFQLLICLAAREHLLPRLPPALATLQLTHQMYEDKTFLRDENLMGNLVQVLLALDDYDIVLEQSLSKGIE